MRLAAIDSISSDYTNPAIRRLQSVNMYLDEENQDKPLFLPTYEKDVKSISRPVLMSEAFSRKFNGYKGIFCKHWYSSANPR